MGWAELLLQPEAVGDRALDGLDLNRAGAMRTGPKLYACVSLRIDLHGMWLAWIWLPLHCALRVPVLLYLSLPLSIYIYIYTHTHTYIYIYIYIYIFNTSSAPRLERRHHLDDAGVLDGSNHYDYYAVVLLVLSFSLLLLLE